MHDHERQQYVKFPTVSDGFLARPNHPEHSQAVRSKDVVRQAAKQGLLLARYRRRPENVQENLFFRPYARFVRKHAQAQGPISLHEWRSIVRDEVAHKIITVGVEAHYRYNKDSAECSDTLGWVLPLDEEGYDALCTGLSTPARELLQMTKVVLGEVHSPMQPAETVFEPLDLPRDTPGVSCYNQQ